MDTQRKCRALPAGPQGGRADTYPFQTQSEGTPCGCFNIHRMRDSAGGEVAGWGWVEKGSKIDPVVLETFRILVVVADSQACQMISSHRTQHTRTHACVQMSTLKLGTSE